MPKITIRNKTIDGPAPYVIAEIGCNHDGDFGKALTMIRAAADCGVDAVKFQKRSPQKLFSAEALAAPYDSPNSHGSTYGNHRRALDWFGKSEFMKISECCFANDVAFICTPFTAYDAAFLADPALELDAFKIASCDLTNIPLIEQVAAYGLPVIISTGGGDWRDIRRAARAVPADMAELAILHCVSTYPNDDDDLNLRKIAHLPTFVDPINFVAGFSSHHPGLLPHYVAYLQGARIFEVHFTLNRGGRGTDHGFSLEPAGLRQICEDLRRIPRMLGRMDRQPAAAEKNGFIKKMGKSIYAARDIAAGEIVAADAIELRAPADGLAPYELNKIIGKQARRTIRSGSLILWPDLIEQIIYPA